MFPWKGQFALDILRGRMPFHWGWLGRGEGAWEYEGRKEERVSSGSAGELRGSSGAARERREATRAAGRGRSYNKVGVVQTLPHVDDGACDPAVFLPLQRGLRCCTCWERGCHVRYKGRRLPAIFAVVW